MVQKRKGNVIIVTMKLTKIKHINHLYRSENGSFCYRQVLPKDIREIFFASEIKRSLHTKNIHEANISSLLVSRFVNLIINNIRNNANFIVNIKYIHSKITDIINYSGVYFDQTLLLPYKNMSKDKYILNVSTTKDNSDNIIVDSIMNNKNIFNTFDISMLENEGTNKGTKTISTQNTRLLDVIKNYKDDMITKNRWSNKTCYQTAQHLDLFYGLIDNIYINNITRSMLNEVVKKLLRYPKNRKKSVKYREIPIKELEKMEIPLEERLDLVTIKNIIGRWNSFLKWSYLNYDNLPAWIYQIMKAPNSDTKELPNEKRVMFTTDDINILFNSEEYLNDKFNKAFKFWLPLLGLYTGARLNELCQLTLKDIIVVDNITCLKITEESSLEYLEVDNNKGQTEKKKFRKQLKNRHSVRTIPLHPTLIEIGFLNYVQHLMKDNAAILFPELVPDNLEGKLSRQVSRWFNEQYLPKLKIKREGLCYHSFRHTFISKFLGVTDSQNNIFEEDNESNIDIIKLKRYVGHKTGKSITLSTYTKDFPPSLLMKDVLGRIDYNVPVDILKQSKYSRI